MGKDIDILIVEPDRLPQTVSIPNTFKAIEEILGGGIQVGCFLPKRVFLISREDKTGLIPNRRIPGSNEYINGTFILCGVPEEGSSFASLTKEQQKEFQKVFAVPLKNTVSEGVVSRN